MKYLLLLLISCNCWAGEYGFTFNLKDGRQLKVKQVADTKWKALEDAGVFCGEFFGIGRKQLSEDEAQDIIDACANPSFE
jgi:hypothetical protein